MNAMTDQRLTTPAFFNGYWSLCAIRFSTSFVAWVDFILIFSTLSFVFRVSTETIGLAAAFYGLPPLLLGPLAGRLADRVNPFLLVTCSFVLRCTASCSLYLAGDAGVFLALVAFKGVSNLGAVPAEVVLTRRLLTDRQIVSNTALVSVVNQFIKVCSPLAAGIVVASTDRPVGFLLSAACAVAGLLFCTILWLQQGGSLQALGTKPKGEGSFAAIKAFYWRGPATRLLLFCSLAQSAVLGFYDSMLGSLLSTSGFGASAFGLVVSATGLGGIVAGIAFKSLYPARVLVCSTVSLMVYGVCILGAGLLASLHSAFTLAILLLVFFCSGITFGLTSMAFAVVLQTQCSPAHLGFISSSVWSLTLALLVSGPVLGGFIAAVTSIQSAFVIAGGTALCIGLALHWGFAGALAGAGHEPATGGGS
jgi:MFS family permease